MGARQLRCQGRRLCQPQWKPPQEAPPCRPAGWLPIAPQACTCACARRVFWHPCLSLAAGFVCEPDLPPSPLSVQLLRCLIAPHLVASLPPPPPRLKSSSSHTVLPCCRGNSSSNRSSLVTRCPFLPCLPRLQLRRLPLPLLSLPPTAVLQSIVWAFPPEFSRRALPLPFVPPTAPLQEHRHFPSTASLGGAGARPCSSTPFPPSRRAPARCM